MKKSSIVFKAGTRGSRLARSQTDDALRHLAELIPGLRFETTFFESPGDRDQQTDLRVSAPDFFTRDLDAAVREGRVDLAVHSAKDLPDPLPAGIDAGWLPWREDPRDALVLPRGRTWGDLPAEPVVGVSSELRETWARARFPGARMVSIRGVIEARLRQLDEGRYDVLIMAAAALNRLGWTERISAYIPLDELSVPDGQGALAITFRAGDARLLRVRNLLMKPVIFAGAGAGRAGSCTLETADALRRADVCLYDALFDAALLDILPPGAQRVDVGKRCGNHRESQSSINALLVHYARRGASVVRLKGGDPGIFGRLAEEIDTLETFALPYRVLPGVSSLQMATTGTGMLLTRRGVSRGFCVMTPRSEGGVVASVGAAARAALPQVYFMAMTAAPALSRELLSEGVAPETPVACVFDAGSTDESIERSTLAALAARTDADAPDRPGLLLVGDVTRHGYDRRPGALSGCRVLLTCSEALQSEAVALTHTLGGYPLPLPVIRLVTQPAAVKALRDASAFDWVVVTSPSAAHAAVRLMLDAQVDVRCLPDIMVCGEGTARALQSYGLQPAACPGREFGAEGLLNVARAQIKPGQRVLRLRSDVAGAHLARALSALGAEVTDVEVVRNVPADVTRVPAFDAVFFASSSAVAALMDRGLLRAEDVAGKPVVAIGKPTAEALAQRGVGEVWLAPEATVASALWMLAGRRVFEAIRDMDAAR